MKIICKKFIAPLIVLAAILAIAVSYWIYKPKDLIVPLPKLVEYYEGQLDPEIPCITVTAEHDGESYVLPYDAAFTSGELLPEEEINRTWFINLMNNFWSLPELANGNSMLQDVSPAQFTIAFDTTPDADVSLINYNITNAYGYVSPHYYEQDLNPYEILGPARQQPMHVTPQNDKISFESWSFTSHGRGITEIPLHGLRVVCSYDGQPVEYYVLFQNAGANGFSETTDFTHLTPLEP